MKIKVGKDVNNFALQLNPKLNENLSQNTKLLNFTSSCIMRNVFGKEGMRLTFSPTLKVVFAMYERVREAFQSD